RGRSTPPATTSTPPQLLGPSTGQRRGRSLAAFAPGARGNDRFATAIPSQASQPAGIAGLVGKGRGAAVPRPKQASRRHGDLEPRPGGGRSHQSQAPPRRLRKREREDNER